MVSVRGSIQRQPIALNNQAGPAWLDGYRPEELVGTERTLLQANGEQKTLAGPMPGEGVCMERKQITPPRAVLAKGIDRLELIARGEPIEAVVHKSVYDEPPILEIEKLNIHFLCF